MKHNWKGMMQRLNDLYFESRSDYQQALYEARQGVFSELAGMTVILAESRDNQYSTEITHVLAPEDATMEHKIGWHDTQTAVLSLDDGCTTLYEVATLELKRGDTWIHGTVMHATYEGFVLRSEGHESTHLKHGDTVRNVAFKESN